MEFGNLKAKLELRDNQIQDLENSKLEWKIQFENLKAKKETLLTINSKSQLEFKYEAKVKHSTDHLYGYLPISTEYQGMKLFVNMVEERGIVKDKRGNVAIAGTALPENQEIIFKAVIKDGTNMSVYIDNYNPAFCQLSVSNGL